MPTKKKFFGRGSVNLAIKDGKPSEAGIRRVARELSISTDDVRGIVSLSNAIRGEAGDGDYTPPQVMSACLAVASEVMAECYAPAHQEQLCSDIYEQLRSACDLKVH